MAGNNLFGADIAGQLNKAMAASFLPCVLIKVTEGGRDAANPAAGKSTSEASHSCRGFLDKYQAGQFRQGFTEAGGTLVKEGTRKALILGNSLPNGIVPEPQDKFTVEGTTFIIVNVTRDPDKATYEMELKGS